MEEENKTIFRDQLAIERTKLANYRTLLAFTRTFLMIIISGVTLIKIVSKDDFLFYIGVVLIPISFVILIIGVSDYLRVKNNLKQIYRK